MYIFGEAITKLGDVVGRVVDDVLDPAGIVTGVVIVGTARAYFHGWQARGLAQISDGDAEFAPGDMLLDEGDVAICEAIDHRAG